MVTFWVIKLILTCSTMRGQLFHTVTVASTDFEWLLWPIIIYVTLNLFIVSKLDIPNMFIHKSEWFWISHKNHFLQGLFLFSARSDKWAYSYFSQRKLFLCLNKKPNISPNRLLLCDCYFGFPSLHKNINKVLQRWRALAF